MHNGVKVVSGGYHGVWMAEIILRLQGHHEPQEERVFHEILQHVPARSTMLELGGFWSYYSLWFQHEIAGASNFIVEPDPHNLEIGRKTSGSINAMATFPVCYWRCVTYDPVPM